MTSVLYLYEFTLLSNSKLPYVVYMLVLYLYEFTLLSNLSACLGKNKTSYTSMNLHYSQTAVMTRRVKHRSYTSMNLHYSQTQEHHFQVMITSYTSMNLHYSQTNILTCSSRCLSYTSMNLHYSQTSNFENPACNWYVNPHLCYTFLYNKYQHISF